MITDVMELHKLLLRKLSKLCCPSCHLVTIYVKGTDDKLKEKSCSQELVSP